MSQKQRRILRMFLWTAAAVVVPAWFADLPAHAKPEYQEIFQRAYPVASDSPLGKASCQACHVAAGPPRRNAYGAAVEKALDAARTKTLTGEILRQAGMTDSDGDGAGNQAEVTAGSLPGDANSLPTQAAAAAVTPTPPAASTPPPTTVPPPAPKAAAASRPAAPGKKRTRPAAPTPAQKKTAPPPKVKAASPATAAAAAKVKPPEEPQAARQRPAVSKPVTPTTPRLSVRASDPATAAATAAPPQSSQPKEAAAPVETATPAPPTPTPTPPPPVTAAPTSSLVSELFNRLVPPHSFHPVIVHFPIALFLFGGICEVLGAWKRRPTLRVAGALNMTAASVTALGALATGFLAMWREGFPLSGTTLIHLCLAVAATAGMGATALLGWSFIHLHKERTSRIYWFLLSVSLLLIGLVGHFGGELVYGS